jgi:hypothetical protein
VNASKVLAVAAVAFALAMANTTAAVAAEPITREMPAWRGELVLLANGRIKARGFNAFVRTEHPQWASDPWFAAANLFGYAELRSNRCEGEGECALRNVWSKEHANQTITIGFVTVSTGDDSNMGGRESATFARARDGLFRFRRGSWAYLCVRGQTAGTFSPTLCP